MIVGMALWRGFCSCWILFWLVACAGVAPDPATSSIDDLPKVELSDAERAQCDLLEQSAIDAVVRRHYEQAEELANRVLASDARSARARAVLGMVKLQFAARSEPVEWRGLRQGEVELALARQLAPQDAFVGWMHAVFLAESGHMSAAAAAAEDALSRLDGAPASERAALLGTAGTYRYELGEERAAKPHLQAYVALRPDDATAHFRLGASLLSIAKTPQGNPAPYKGAQADAEGAARAFARCFELAPGDQDAGLAVAAAWLRAAELVELRKKVEDRDAELTAEAEGLRQLVVDHLRKFAKEFPTNAEAHFRLGVVAALQQQPQVARAAYVAALERDADHVGSLMNLAALTVGAGELETARGLYARLLAAPSARRELGSNERQRIETWLRTPVSPPADNKSSRAAGVDSRR